MTSTRSAKVHGFSLIELSVALVALGLVLLGATMIWQQQARVRTVAVQQDAQAQSRHALLGYLFTHYRLPCPAVDANGVESCTVAGGALLQIGFVPWATLGLPRPEAGRLRYGVYRDAAVPGPGDRDLASATDRMNVLRVRTPTPRPQNARAPNPTAPPYPVAAPERLGATRSGDPAAPLNTACNAANGPPCPAGGAASVGMADLCLALNTTAELGAAPAGRLAVVAGGVRRPVAFVVVAPGLLDADNDGSLFDGANASASPADPTFASSSLGASHTYDDRVLSASPAELFGELHCAAGLAAVAHAHSNAAIAAFTLERALYDYRDQLDIKVELALADVYASTAGLTGSAAGVLDAAQAMTAAVADTTLSAGARSFQIALAGVGLGTAAASVAAAIATEIISAKGYADAQELHSDFAARTTAATDLSISVNRNALTADAVGF